MMSQALKRSDPAVSKIIAAEERRQQDTLSLIPSENFFSPAVREAVGSVFSHKYAEGNIGHRYYEGNEFVDELETLAIARARRFFKLPRTWGVNVQALSGASANVAVYLAVLKPGDTILGMYLPDGGHLSHGWSYDPGKTSPPTQTIYPGGSRKVTLTSRLFKTISYKTSPTNQQFDYQEIAKAARKYRPQLIITGGTAYPRDINYRRIKAIAKKVGALFVADIAHEAGLIGAGALPSPVGIADIVTLTTHKTLRAGRGAIILAPAPMIQKINRAVMPGLQGGPHNHNIAGICVGLGEALRPDFKRYARGVITNAQFLANQLMKYDFDLVTGGTDKHLILINLINKPLLGRKFARALRWAGIITNFNTMPQETRLPTDPSALRLGTPWVTTRGMGKPEMKQIAAWLDEVMTFASPWADLPFPAFETRTKASRDIRRIAREVKILTRRFPLPF